MLPLGSVHGGPLPSTVRIACLVDGELKEARYGEVSHRDICRREALPGSTLEEGFSVAADADPD